MKTIFFIPIFASLLISCGKNSVENDLIFDGCRIQNILFEKGSALKYVFKVDDSNIKTLWEVYEYNDVGKISRVNSLHNETGWQGYSIYSYNIREQLEKVSTYQQYKDEPVILNQTVEYSYNSNGKLETKVVKSFNFNVLTTSFSFLYDYDGEKIFKEDHFSNDKKYSCLVYVYDNGKLLRQESYDMDDNNYQTVEHSYFGHLLVYSITYQGDPKTGFLRDEKRYYDLNDNLVRTIQRDLMLSSSSTPYTTIWGYEYE
jgi:hypothetical protein